MVPGHRVYAWGGKEIIRRVHGHRVPGHMVPYGARHRVQGAGCRVQGAGCRLQDAGRQGAGYRVQGAGCRVQGTGYRLQGAGFGPSRRRPPSHRPTPPPAWVCAGSPSLLTYLLTHLLTSIPSSHPASCLGLCGQSLTRWPSAPQLKHVPTWHRVQGT